MRKESITEFSRRFGAGCKWNDLGRRCGSGSKWMALALSLCMLCPILGACGSQASAPAVKTNSTEPAVRVGSVEALLQHGLLTGKEENPFGIVVSYVKPVQEGTLLLWTDGTSARISLVDSEKKTLRDASMPDTFLGEPMQIAQADDGWVILSSGEDEFYHVQYYLTKVASDFSPVTDTVCLNELTDSTEVYGFECIGSNVVLSGDTGVFFYDLESDFALSGKMTPKDPIYDFSVSGGKLYALQDIMKDQTALDCEVLLSEVDISGHTLTNTKTIRTGSAYALRLFGDKEGFSDTIAFAFSDGLYLYATDGSSLKKEFSCYAYIPQESDDTSSGAGAHSIEAINEIWRAGEGIYRACGNYNIEMYTQGGNPLVMMDITPRDSLAKKSLKVGVLTADSAPEIYNMCDYINTLNLPYSLDVTVYYDPSDSEFDRNEYTTARLTFLRDAISADPPDLLILTPQEREMFAAQDALLDLMPYIDNSASFDPSDMQPNVWSALTAGGTCGWISPYVYLEGTAITEEAATELGAGGLEDIRAYMAAHPEETLLSGGLTGEFQNLLLERVSDTITAGADNSKVKAEVVDILRLMVEMKTQAAANNGTGEKPACCSPCSINGLMSYYSLLLSNPDPLLIRGDLGRLDKGPYIMADGGMSISAGSDQPDLSWSAIEFMLSEEIQDLFHNNIPLRQSSSDTKLLGDAVGLEDTALIITHNSELVVGSEGNSYDEQKQYDVKMNTALIRDYRQLIASADTLSYLNEDLFFLLYEDLAPCLAGDVTPEDTADRMIDRVGLYLSEHANGNS